MIFQESALAHHYLDGLFGIEVGGSAHNPFGLDTINIDYTVDDTEHVKEQTKMCGMVLPVDIIASGDELPMKNNSVDFVISSHVLEHFPNPIKALIEWDRVVKSNGFIFMIVPHKNRTFDSQRKRTTYGHLLSDYRNNNTKVSGLNGHCHVWVTEDIVELCTKMIKWHGMNWVVEDIEDMDSKVGNGFTVVLRKVNRDS